MVERRLPRHGREPRGFAPPPPARREADLAGLDRVVAGVVGAALKGDARSRDEIAGAMTAVLGEPVSRAMLDAYASPARETHNISLARALALFAVTGRVDLLASLCRRIGVDALSGDELTAARLGQLHAERLRLDTEIATINAHLRPDRGGLA